MRSRDIGVQLWSFNGRNRQAIIRIVEVAEDLSGDEGSTTPADFENLSWRGWWLQISRLGLGLGSSRRLAVLVVEHEVAWESDGQMGTFLHGGDGERLYLRTKKVQASNVQRRQGWQTRWIKRPMAAGPGWWVRRVVPTGSNSRSKAANATVRLHNGLHRRSRG